MRNAKRNDGKSMCKNKTDTIEGDLTDLPYYDATACVLGEMIVVVLEGFDDNDVNDIFPIEMYFVKPNRATYILETRSATDKPLPLDSLFRPGEKKEYFDKRVNLLRDCIRIKPFNQRWNKARLILHDQKKYTFEYRFDRDIHWLYSVPPEHPALKEHDLDTLKRIGSWDGLPTDHHRPWLITEEKSN